MHIKKYISAAETSNLIRNKLQLLHVVRRYGPVGGMERYVWELTLQLQQLGQDITVICERCHAKNLKELPYLNWEK